MPIMQLNELPDDLSPIRPIIQEWQGSFWNEQGVMRSMRMAGYSMLCYNNELGVMKGVLLFLKAMHEWELLFLYTAKSDRRQGIGNSLVSEFITKADEVSVGRIHLEVRVTNENAISLYEKFGFAKMGLRKKYYADGEDALRMIRRLR